jgi:hypothetical protein
MKGMRLSSTKPPNKQFRPQKVSTDGLLTDDIPSLPTNSQISSDMDEKEG